MNMYTADIIVAQDNFDDALDLLVVALDGRLPNQLIERVETGLKQCPVL